MRVLITGGGGFIGGHLASHLLGCGHEVVLVDDFSRGVRDEFLQRLGAEERCSIIAQNLLSLDPGTLPQDVEVVVHLAAIIGVRHVQERPGAVLEDNVRMTSAALDYARRLPKLHKFLFASTSEVYAGTLRHFDLPVPTPESTPLAVTPPSEARTSYMLSKIYGEAMCHHSGLPCVIFRPHNVYGERMGMVHVIPELLQKAYRAEDGDVLPVYSVDHRRAFCHVADAVEMLRLLIESDLDGVTLNLGHEEEELAIGELAEKVAATVGRSLQIEALPATPGSPPRRCPDMTRMQELTGYRARIDVDEGLRRTFAWYRENVFEGSGRSAL